MKPIINNPETFFISHDYDRIEDAISDMERIVEEGWAWNGNAYKIRVNPNKLFLEGNDDGSWYWKLGFNWRKDVWDTSGLRQLCLA